MVAVKSKSVCLLGSKKHPGSWRHAPKGQRDIWFGNGQTCFSSVNNPMGPVKK